jgi:hypothetical protein
LLLTKEKHSSILLYELVIFYDFLLSKVIILAKHGEKDVKNLREKEGENER